MRPEPDDRAEFDLVEHITHHVKMSVRNKGSVPLSEIVELVLEGLVDLDLLQVQADWSELEAEIEETFNCE